MEIRGCITKKDDSKSPASFEFKSPFGARVHKDKRLIHEPFINFDVRKILNFENEVNFESNLCRASRPIFSVNVRFSVSGCFLDAQGTKRERKREHLLANAVNLGKKPVSVSERGDT